ncbi:hypothetical protein MWR57_03025 [Desulfovibrionaceae bacterium CB1MN]|uniref:hypothetical protein n=1 Tax=Hydrosulfovibrio ferrireducens TaxID=2934181 RepID=UPI003ABB042F
MTPRLRGLKQSDLFAEIGGQSVVSEILVGKREINARQTKALAARFGVLRRFLFDAVRVHGFHKTWSVPISINVVCSSFRPFK